MTQAMYTTSSILSVFLLIIIFATIIFASLILIRNTEKFFKKFEKDIKTNNISNTVVIYVMVLFLLVMVSWGNVLFKEINPGKNNLIFLNIDVIKSKTNNIKNLNHINTLVKDTESKLILICDKETMDKQKDVKVYGKVLGLKGEVIDVVPLLPPELDENARIQVWLKGIDFRPVKNVLVISDYYETFGTNIKRLSSLYLNDESVTKTIEYLNKVDSKIKIGAIKICETAIKQEMSFGGLKVQKKLLK